MGWIDKLFGGARNAEDEPTRLLREALLPLALIDQGTLERTVAYVREGTGAEVVFDLQGRDTTRVAELARIDSRPAGSWYGSAKPSVDEVRSLGVGADVDLSGLVRGARRAWATSAEASAEQSARLGRVMAAVGPTPATAGAETPGWLAAFAYDVQVPLPAPAPAAATTPQALVEIGRAGGLTDDEADRAVLRLMLDIPPGRPWEVRGSDALLKTDAAPHTLLRRRDLVAEMAPRLPAGAKTALIDRLLAAGMVDDFAAELAALAVDRAKAVRTRAVEVLSALDAARQAEVLLPVIAAAPAATIEPAAASLAGRTGGAEALAGLIAESKGARRAALETVVERASLTSAASSSTTAARAVGELPPFEPVPDTEVAADFVDRARALVREHTAVLRERRETILADPAGDPSGWRLTWVDRDLERLREITPGMLREARAVLNGADAPFPPALRHELTRAALAELGRELSLLHWLRVEAASERPDARGGLRLPWQLVRVDDLRVLLDACERAGVDDPVHAVALIGIDSSHVAPAGAWPFYVEHPELLRAALAGQTIDGSSSWAAEYRRPRALAIVEAAPFLDGSLIPGLAEIALGAGKTHRRRAQQLLARHDAARALAEQGLRDRQVAVRAASARWLATLGGTEAIAAVTAAAASERSESGRAAMISALEALGADTSAYLAPEVLLAEAKKGLKRPVTALDWFFFDGLPRVHWAGGAPVDPDIVRWWVVLAHKLKEPDGRGIVSLYLGRLEREDAAALGRFVLEAWIAEDTRRPSQEEAREFAAEQAPLRHAQAQQSLARAIARSPEGNHEWIRERAAITLEQHHEAAYREHLNTYLSTAATDKGLLALTVALPGSELAGRTLSYIKNHKGRRSQTESLVVACAGNGEPAALQVVLSVARRFAMTSVRDAATRLVESIADERGWTMEQLADRTVPTAGFDDDGLLRLHLGRRTYTGRITQKLTIELSNDDGKVVKSLPAAGQGGDAELAAEAKKQLAASRKELTQVLATQTARLYEAMCLQREWPAEQWQQYVHEHPVMCRLAARLVWVRRRDGSATLFRPPGDGALLDADDTAIELGEGDTVSLAHSAVVESGQAQRWLAHLSDYRVDPLFAQFGTTVPPFAPGAVLLEDRKGWLSDTFAIRGRVTARGYTRNLQGESWFDAYQKEFSAAGVSAVISFTGSYVPESQLPAAITTLTFLAADSFDALPLDAVPPVLLAEAHGDYVAIAEAGAFDPGWEKATR